MQTITKEYQVYTFEELTKEAQKKALANHYTDHIYPDWWADDLIREEITPKLEVVGFMTPEVLYSGFSNQGDGASFTCDEVDIGKLGQALKYPQTDIDLIAEGMATGGVTATVTRHNGNYVHENMCKFDLDVDVDWGMQSEQEAESLSVLCDLFAEKAEALRYNLCKEIYKELEDEYIILTSDDYITEHIINNDYQFLADGSDFNQD